MSFGDRNDDVSQGGPTSGRDVGEGVYQSEFDRSERPVSEVVVSAVSVATETDPLELPPLYETVDPDALDALFRPTSQGSQRNLGEKLPVDGTTIAFTYAGSRVQLFENGVVSVEPN